MNIFVYELAKSKVSPKPELSPTKFVVEDNVGESIHLHYRNTRLDFTVEEFMEFAENVEKAAEVLEDGNR